MVATTRPHGITTLLVILLVLVLFNTVQIYSISKTTVLQAQEGFKEAELRYVSLEVTSHSFELIKSATGVNIGNQYILTAAHIIGPVHDSNQYRITMRDAQDKSSSTHSGELLHFVAYDTEKDLLLLKRITPANPSSVAIAPSLREGDELISFSNPRGLGKSFNVYTVSRFALEESREDHYDSFVVNGFVFGGQSGGALFTRDGLLAGIHLKGDNPHNSTQIPYGISITPWEIRSFLHRNGVPYVSSLSWSDKTILLAQTILRRGMISTR